MPEYAPDLMRYLDQIGDRLPFEALADPALLQGCLSKQAPIALVAKVAEALGDGVDEHPAVAALTLFEKGRVMSALGRKEEARFFYTKAPEAWSNDPAKRGPILINWANDTTIPAERERLLREAVQMGYDEALAHLGMFLYQNGGRTEEALEVLLESVRRGINLGIPFIGMIYLKTKQASELDTAMAELFAMAKAAGTEDAVSAPFDEMDARTIAKSRDGKPINLLTHGRNLRSLMTRWLDAMQQHNKTAAAD